MLHPKKRRKEKGREGGKEEEGRRREGGRERDVKREEGKVARGHLGD